MRVAIIDYAHRPDLESPRELCEAYTTVVGWATNLKRSGCTVRVFQGFSTDERIDLNGVIYQFVGGPFSPDLARWRLPLRLHAFVTAWGPDVVHFNGLTYPMQLIHLRARIARRCAIVMQHHAARPMQGWRRLVQRVALRCADGALFSGPEVARPWVDRGLLGDPTPVWTLPEASSRLVPGDRQRCREQTGLEGDPQLLWVGNLDENKDPLAVLDAVGIAAEKLRGIRLAMAWRSAPLLEQVRARIKTDAELVNRVDLLGPVAHEEIGRLMSASDLLVQASRREGSGYAVIDALACGLPPVVTEIPSFQYLTDRGRIGALFRVGDANHLARTIVRIVNAGNPDRGEPALRWFRTKLSWPAVARRAVAAYRLAIWLRGQP